jgi:hypothetical protein
MQARHLPITALLAVTVAVAGCGETPSAAPSAGSPAIQHHHKAKHHAKRRTAHRATAVRPAATGTAAAALAKLTVKGRAPKTGYSRTQFGDGWIDTGGCDARDHILARDLIAKSYLDDCRVQSGTLADPYTAERIQYTRGGSSEVDIGRALGRMAEGRPAVGPGQPRGVRQRPARAARGRRAHQPRQGRRGRRHLAASEQGVPLRLRGPPVAVKTKYKLWVTQAEKDAIGRVLASCPGQRLPARGAPIPVTVTRTPPARTPTPGHTSTSGGGSGTGHVYANCAVARAAGVTPILRGTPDYAANPRLDRDHDGVACES